MRASKDHLGDYSRCSRGAQERRCTRCRYDNTTVRVALPWSLFHGHGTPCKSPCAELIGPQAVTAPSSLSSHSKEFRSRCHSPIFHAFKKIKKSQFIQQKYHQEYRMYIARVQCAALSSLPLGRRMQRAPQAGSYRRIDIQSTRNQLKCASFHCQVLRIYP